VVAACALWPACRVFDPPELDQDGGSGGAAGAPSGGSAGAGESGSGGLGGSGGEAGSSGGSAGADASVPRERWWERTTPEGCESAGVPRSTDRPQASGGTPLAPIYLATTRLRFGAANDDDELTRNEDAWKEIGLDLDLSCTASETCSVGGSPLEQHACKNAFQVPFDGKDCRDNQIGKLFPIATRSPLVGLLFGISEANWNCAVHRGELSIFLKLSGYDGSKNDSSVRLDVYVSTGLQALPSWTCTSGPSGSVPPDWYDQAPWLHTKPWKIARRSISLNAQDAGVDLPDSKHADPAAFVRDGWLVAQLPPATEFWLNGERSHIPGFRLQFHRAVLLGKLEKGLDGIWRLGQGTIGGLVKAGEILAAFREIGFCENMCDGYTSVTAYLNTAQDALSTATEPLPDTPCDSLSLGIGFEARQAAATAADVEPVAEPVDCPPPRHPLAPQHGCVCPDPGVGGPCVSPEGGS
jgi:hypothetical protein